MQGRKFSKRLARTYEELKRTDVEFVDDYGSYLFFTNLAVTRDADEFLLSAYPEFQDVIDGRKQEALKPLVRLITVSSFFFLTAGELQCIEIITHLWDDFVASIEERGRENAFDESTRGCWDGYDFIREVRGSDKHYTLGTVDFRGMEREQ